MVTRGLLCTLVSILIVPLAAAQIGSGHSPLKLQLNETLSDSLGPDSSHSYTLDLEAEQFVFGESNQQTVDVVVTVHGPDDSVIGTFDGLARGPEMFQFDTEDAGTYRVEVSSFEKEQGRYTIQLHYIEPIAKAPEQRIDQLVAAFTGTAVPGGVVGVIQDGRLAHATSFGMSNLSYNIPFSTETLTNIGSVSKQFTAFAIALLAERGQLSLDDDVRTHIPELPDFGPTVTLRHWLTHTSGYREFLNALYMGGRRLGEGDFIDRDELIEIVQRQPELQNEPGAEWNYNNTGFGLLPVVVERVTGTPFPDWMEHNVFEPLGMEHTVVRKHPLQIVANASEGYVGSEEGGYRETTDLGAAMGAGAMYTTAGDLAKWMQNFHEPMVGSHSLIEQMTTPYVLTNGDTTNYGLGIVIDEHRGLRRFQHGGADIAHRARLLYYPDLNVGVVTMSNNGAFPGSIAAEVAETYFGDHMAQEEPVEITENESAAVFDPERYDPESFDELAGQYELDDMPGFILTFTREDDELFAQATGQPRLSIVPTSDSTFRWTTVDASLTFHKEQDGGVKSLTLHQNGIHRGTRIEEARWKPSPDELSVYTGRYFSTELETFYDLTVKDSALVIGHRRLDDIELTPTKKDLFGGSMPVAKITFLRSEDGAVDRFTASNGRTRGVLFERVDP